MGIGGITYTDGRGRRKNIDAASLDDFKSRFASFSPRQRATPPLPPQGASSVRQSAPDVMPGAGIVNTRNGLALRGEESDPTVAGKKIYGSVDGRKGWQSLDEIDPNVGGRRIGRGADTDNEVDALTPDGDEVTGFDGTPMNVPFLSRVALTGGIDGVYELTAFERETKYSEGRRAGGITKETAVPVGTIYVPGGGGGGQPGSKFHFAFITELVDEQAVRKIGEGAVQIGGYTYFVAEQQLAQDISSGTWYVCVRVELASGTAGFVAYNSTSALRSAQANMAYYIFPIYRTANGAVDLDYRPLPNAGSWEIAESVSNGGSSS